MTLTVISTVTSANVTLNYLSHLVITSTGVIAGEETTINGSTGTRQTITSDGLIEVYSIWLGGQNTLNFTENSTTTTNAWGGGILIGYSSLGAISGNSTINTAGMISAYGYGLDVYGSSNILNNSGLISSTMTAVTMGNGGGSNSIYNSGIIVCDQEIAVQLGGANGKLDNLGSITSINTFAVAATGATAQIHNSGLIRGDYTGGMSISGQTSALDNSGTISGQQGIGLELFGAGAAVFNSGQIDGSLGAVLVLGTGAAVVNDGTLSSSRSAAMDASGLVLLDTVSLINRGLIQGATYSYLGGDATDRLTNRGDIIGVVELGNGDDLFDGRGGTVSGYVSGGDGNDTYYIDDGSIVINEATLGGYDTVFSAANYHLAYGAEGLTLLGANELRGFGNSGDNYVMGNVGANRLVGLGGVDFLTGDLGADTLLGGLGNDDLSGGDENDLLMGQVGNDDVSGDEGDDRLSGGLGRDTLTGDEGQDTFVFATLAHSGITTVSSDTIRDFIQGEDVIDLGGIDAVRGNAGANDAFVFIGGAAFSLVAGQLRYLQSAGSTFVQMDVNGDGVSDSVIKLTGLVTLTGGDFVL